MPESQKRTWIFVDTFRYTLRLLRLIRAEIPLAIVVLVGLSLVDSFWPLIRGKSQEWLIDSLTASIGLGAMTPQVEFAFAAFVAILVYGAVDGYVMEYVQTVVFERVRTKIDLVLRGGMARLDVAHYEDPSFMDTMDKATGEGEHRVRVFLENQMHLAIYLGTIVVSAVAIGYQKWWLLPVIVIFTIPELVVRSHFARRIWDLRTQQAELRRRLHAERGLFASIPALVELKIGGTVRYFLDRMERALNRIRRTEVEYSGSRSRAMSLSSLLAHVGIIIALYVFAVDVIEGTITVGRLVFLLTTIVAFRANLAQFFRMLSANYEHTLFLRDVFALLDAQPRVLPPAHPQALDASTTPEIRFENVSFAYPHAADPALVLKGVSFTIRPGEKIALVGVNGAGKTTIIKLLCRFYDPTEGRITVGGIDLRDMDLGTWYRQLGVLFQDYTTHRGMTVREAIHVGDVDRDESDGVEEAARQAEADAFIEALPNRYEQLMGKMFKGGMAFSGGQQQKLALARVFYRDPKVWVLDEPTAAIDAEAEAHIFDRIEETLVGRSAIIISHRFSTVRNADRILVLKDGVIAEEGTHEELMRNPQDYARLFTLQARRYEGKGE